MEAPLTKCRVIARNNYVAYCCVIQWLHKREKTLHGALQRRRGAKRSKWSGFLHVSKKSFKNIFEKINKIEQLAISLRREQHGSLIRAQHTREVANTQHGHKKSQRNKNNDDKDKKKTTTTTTTTTATTTFKVEQTNSYK